MVVVFKCQRINARIHAQRLTYCYALPACTNSVIVINHLVVIHRQVFLDIVEVILIIVSNAIRRLLFR